MTTARDLLTRSLRLARVIGEDVTPSASMLNDAFLDLNELLDSWSNQRLFIYDIQPLGPYTLVAGTSDYTIGSGGTINVARPLQIESMFTRTSSVDYGIVFRAAEWYEALQLKSVQGRPTHCWYETSYPLGTLHLWPTPDAAYSLYFTDQKLVSTLASLDTAFSVPPGYLMAIRYKMACLLAPQYNLPIPADVDAEMRNAIAVVKRTNIPPSIAGYDAAITQRPVLWNWMSGG